MKAIQTPVIRETFDLLRPTDGPAAIRLPFRWPTAALLSTVLVLSSWHLAHGQSSSASYQIPRQTIDAGAGRSTSASYTLNGSIGQPDAGPRMTSASYRLTGGFHRASTAGEQGDSIFADRFQGKQ